MSDLAFLSSDDEVELDKASASALASASASDSGKIVEEQNLIVNEEDEDESDEEFGNDFEFGGLLGEDGENHALSNLLAKPGSNAWSYKAALNILQQNDNDANKNGYRPERTNVASIIAAARRNLKLEELEQDKIDGGDSGGDSGVDVEDVVGEEEDSEESSSDNDNDNESETKEDDTNNDNDNDDDDSSDDDDDDDDDDDSSSSGEESSDDEVDDTLKAKEMDQDVVRLRESKRKKIKPQHNAKDSNESDGDDESDHDDEDDSESEQDDYDSDREEKQIEARKAAKYFDKGGASASRGSSGSSHSNEQDQSNQLFVQLNLSRPLLRGVASIGFVTPTPIQARCIPIALSGRDVCASAQTGSGKTAAFLLPIMERILQRGGGKVQMQLTSKKSPTISATRGLILTPTRELAAQCLGMMTAMAKFTSLRAALVVGGAKNVNAQAAELRTRPDVIVATPGRLIDHLTNSSGVDLDDLEFLILDEADRLLDLGFQDEIHEIVKACPAERQTMLFSATMGTKVADLIKLSLKRPVRIHVTAQNNSNDGAADGVEVANRLEQEFVRVRAQNEGVNREAMLLALLTRTFTKRTIVFFDTKAEAHRLMIICGLCGIKCAELHGNLTQVQRLEALENFREGSVEVLLATDLAARGLDISSVEAVVNFEMPGIVETYVHRIGRTARAGRAGKACTLIGEGRRQLMKAVMKDAEQKRSIEESKARKGKTKASSATGAIRSRTIPTVVLKHFAAKIISLEPHVKEVYVAEAVARMDRMAEMEANKAKNIINHSSDIRARPQREWFASNKEKISAKERYLQKQEDIKAKVGTGIHRMTRKKRRMREAKAEFDEMQEEAMDSYEETGQRPKQIMTETVVKASAKAHKKELYDKKRQKDSKSLHEEDIERKERAKKFKATKKRKGAFATDALGDSDLFGDEAVAYSAKPKQAPVAAKSDYEFTEYDPNKPTRKHKQKAHHGFKSKSKFKRRK